MQNPKTNAVATAVLSIRRILKKIIFRKAIVASVLVAKSQAIFVTRPDAHHTLMRGATPVSKAYGFATIFSAYHCWQHRRLSFSVTGILVQWLFSSLRQQLMQSKNHVFANRPNPALNPAPFSRWTLRDKAAQRRLALR